MDHPDIKHIEMYGTDPHEKEPLYIGEDSRRIDMYSGDEIYTFGDDCFVVEELSLDAQEVLEILGASRSTIF